MGSQKLFSAAPLSQGVPQWVVPHVWFGRVIIPDALPDATLKGISVSNLNIITELENGNSENVT